MTGELGAEDRGDEGGVSSSSDSSARVKLEELKRGGECDGLGVGSCWRGAAALVDFLVAAKSE